MTLPFSRPLAHEPPMPWNPRRVICPSCGVGIGRACRNPATGVEQHWEHGDRKIAAARREKQIRDQARTMLMPANPAPRSLHGARS